MSARFIVKFIFLNFWIEIVFPGWLQWKNLMLWSSSCDSARFPISRVKLYSCKMWNWFLEVSASQYFVHYLSRGHYCYNQQSTAHLLFQFNHILIKYLANALRGVLYFKWMCTVIVWKNLFHNIVYRVIVWKNFLQNNFSFYRSRDANDTGQMNNKMGNDQYCLRYMKEIKISLWGLKKTYA